LIGDPITQDIVCIAGEDNTNLLMQTIDTPDS